MMKFLVAFLLFLVVMALMVLLIPSVVAAQGSWARPAHTSEGCCCQT